MRLIKTFSSYDEGQQAQLFLNTKKIPSRLDRTNTNNYFELWIYEEDQLELANSFLKEWTYKPEPILNDFIEKLTIQGPIIKKSKKTIVSSGIFWMCCVLYLADFYWSPIIHQYLLYSTSSDYWTGFYSYLQPGLKESINTNQLFHLIKHGQIWRLFTPAFLHHDILHILFNLLWWKSLGPEIERNIGSWRFFILFLICAAFSNTAQYLMTGYNFLGLSGVICGLIGFIWVRQKKTPWEGYSLNQSQLSYFAIFLLLTLSLSLLSFISETLFQTSIGLNIANTAHFSGLLCGIYLAQGTFFQKRG